MNPQDLRTPLGTRDIANTNIIIRNLIFQKSKECFEKRDAVEIDTPVVELYTLVKNLYGGDFNKLVYTLDDGNEKLILRYDQTVPLARYIAMNGLKQFRRYQISKVYRKDEPQVSKGRYREFYQCDFDIVGDDQKTNIYDIEILDLAVDVLNNLIGKNTYKIQLNNRNILYTMLTSFGILENQLNNVCIQLDKLDKKTWEEIRKDIRKEIKDIDADILNNIDKFIQKISEYINKNNIMETLSFLEQNKYISNETFIQMNYIFKTLDALNIINNFVFNPLLSRGMDYYTGIIFEATYNDKSIIDNTICAGGRYDNMIGKFSNQGNIPAIGLSIGVERIASILEKMGQFIKPRKSDIYVASIGADMLQERIKLCCELRNMGFKVMMSQLANPKMRPQFDDVFNNNIPYMIVIGSNEIKDNKLMIKDVVDKSQASYDKNEGIVFLKGILL
jgi:histidyl-tRNA synthetase